VPVLRGMMGAAKGASVQAPNLSLLAGVKFGF
jgi:hypothetical protein